MTESNMKLWNSVCVTDPSHTKKVNQRGGFTAIDAHYQIQEMTRAFGPIGIGWGYDFTYEFFNGMIFAKVVVWHSGDRSQTVTQMGCKSLGKADRPDEDAAKKAVTDGLTKCVSYIGFNADVFLGRFDDNKYVQQASSQKAIEAESKWDNWRDLNVNDAKKCKTMDDLKTLRKTIMALTGVPALHMQMVDQALKARRLEIEPKQQAA